MMPEMQHDVRTVTAGSTLTADGSSDSSAQPDGPIIALDHLYPIDQSDRQAPEDEEPPFILWGDVLIESRHPGLIEAATRFSS